MIAYLFYPIVPNVCIVYGEVLAPCSSYCFINCKSHIQYYVIQWTGDYQKNALTTSIQLSLAVIEPSTGPGYQWESFIISTHTKTSPQALQCFRWNLNYVNYFEYRLLAVGWLYNHVSVCLVYLLSSY